MSVTTEIKQKLKPLMDVLSIQGTATRDVLREQMNFVGECLNVSKRHTDSLRGNTDVAAVFRAPVDAGREISNSWMTTAGRQLEIMKSAGTALTSALKPSNADVASSDRSKSKSEAEQATGHVEATIIRAES